MPQPYVIARAFGGKPLKRVSIHRKDGLIYLSHPDLVEDVATGESHPVGFPSYEVYHFDPIEFSALEMEWTMTGATTAAAWRKLKRINEGTG
jgi:hypothetical protein